MREKKEIIRKIDKLSIRKRERKNQNLSILYIYIINYDEYSCLLNIVDADA